MKKKIIFCAFLLFCQTFLSFSQVKVTFKTNQIPSSKDLSVHLFLAGDFNGWNPSDKASEMLHDSAGYYRVVKTLAPGVYNFKVTRGDWKKVECTETGKTKGNRSATIAHDTTIVLAIAGWQDNFKPEERKHTASANVHIISEKFD